jgi:hypothetical protein
MMKIGQLSKVTGCSIQAIRHYEKEHLLACAERSEDNFRLYDEVAIEELLFIKHCRGLDISLQEIRQLRYQGLNPIILSDTIKPVTLETSGDRNQPEWMIGNPIADNSKSTNPDTYTIGLLNNTYY